MPGSMDKPISDSPHAHRCCLCASGVGPLCHATNIPASQASYSSRSPPNPLASHQFSPRVLGLPLAPPTSWRPHLACQHTFWPNDLVKDMLGHVRVHS